MARARAPARPTELEAANEPVRFAFVPTDGVASIVADRCGVEIIVGVNALDFSPDEVVEIVHRLMNGGRA